MAATPHDGESPPTAMRAWTHTKAGPPSAVLTLSSSVSVPKINSATDVLVRISYASLNPGASILMQLLPSVFRTKPAIPEMDFSGEIAAVGPGVPASRGLSVGSQVFGSILIGSHLRGAGALAEYVVVSADSVVRKFENQSLEEAAGLGVAGCTAVTLIERAKLKRGHSVLVNGASGGIGTFVVQMAKNIVGESGRVVAVCSGRNAQLVKMIGADDVGNLTIRYSLADDFADYREHAPVHVYLSAQFAGSYFSAVIDAYGVQEIYSHCEKYLSPRGPFVTVGVAFKEYGVCSMIQAVSQILGNILWPRMLGGVQREYALVTGIADSETMGKLAEWVEKRELKVIVDSCWDVEDAVKAYDILLSRRSRGKVIVKIR